MNKVTASFQLGDLDATTVEEHVTLALLKRNYRFRTFEPLSEDVSLCSLVPLFYLACI